MCIYTSIWENHTVPHYIDPLYDCRPGFCCCLQLKKQKKEKKKKRKRNKKKKKLKRNPILDVF